MNETDMRPFALRVIRIGLVAGVLIFLAVSWFLQRDRTPSGDFSFLAPAILGVCGIAIVGVIILRRMLSRADTFQRKSELAIIGWALGEAAALICAVHYFLSGLTTWLPAGLGVMFLALIGLPVPEDDGA